MREVSFETTFLKHPAGSCIASYGDTKVLCTATIEDTVPRFLEGTGQGWLTAEYAMLPGSTPGGRKRREILKRDGRSTEIQRLIGRSLRAAVKLESLGEVSIVIDCDVLQADGGTRTAAISGGWVVLYEALRRLCSERPGASDDSAGSGEGVTLSGAASEGCAASAVMTPEGFLHGQVAAVSVGIVDGEVVCDLDYEHDSRAEVDMNVVKRDDNYVEIQGTGERGIFDRSALDELLAAADEGIGSVFRAQRKALNL